MAEDSSGEQLVRACRYGDLSQVQDIVRGGADINYCHSFNNTPLIWSLVNKQWNISDYLLSLPGINVNIRDSYGRSALHYACSEGASINIVQTILNKASREVINSRNSDNYTAIMFAVKYNHIELVRHLGVREEISWEKDELIKVARYDLVCRYK